MYLSKSKKKRSILSFSSNRFQKKYFEKFCLINFSLKQLISANAHLGYEVSRWNPEMKSYLWGVRNGMHILNIQETSMVLRRIFSFSTSLIKLRKLILFASENKHIDHVLKKIILLEEQHIASNRWIGGIITNFRQIRKNVRMLSRGYNTVMTYNLLSNRRKKLKLALEGLLTLFQLPSLIIVLNGVKSKWVINEVMSKNIPCAAILDSVANTKVHFPIPGNVYGFATQILYLKLFLNVIKNARLQEIILFHHVLTLTNLKKLSETKENANNNQQMPSFITARSNPSLSVKKSFRDNNKITFKSAKRFKKM